MTTVIGVTVYAIASLKFTDRDEAAFRNWAESPDYQRISEDRHAGADTVLVQAIRG